MLVRDTVDKDRKNRLLNYLYRDENIIDFMFNDLYFELNCVLPKKICFSNDNLNKATRGINLKKTVTIVNEFLNKNKKYYYRLLELFPCKDYDVLVGDIIVGYVLYLTPHINRGTGADVFADKRSVCYTKVSILDFI